jgi:hypothetical protein
MRGAGLLWRQNLVWVKNAMVLMRSDYHYQHEPIMYGFTSGGTGRLGRGGEHWFGDNAQTTVFEFDKPSRSTEHRVPNDETGRADRRDVGELLPARRHRVRSVRG